MDIESMAVELLRFMETLPRRAPQNWLSDFSRGELFLLCYLHTNDGIARPGTMRDALQTSTARIAAALNSLERKGFVRREQDSADRRRRIVLLTEKGSEHIAGHLNRALRNITKLLNVLGQEDAAEFMRITQRLEIISRDIDFEI